MSELTPMERFERWHVRAIDKLGELPAGDGAFAALMITIPLYERLIKAKLKVAGKPADEQTTRAEMKEDLKLDDKQMRVFWAMFRNGFMHQAMPKGGKTEWWVSHKFGARPEFVSENGVVRICLDPWKFADRTLEEYCRNPKLITASGSFPLADIFVLPDGP